MDQGGLLTVESASLPVATFAKFQPHSVDFLDLTNPKAVLESKLRNFACLSTGDVIAITYNNKVCIYFNTACNTFPVFKIRGILNNLMIKSLIVALEQ